MKTSPGSSSNSPHSFFSRGYVEPGVKTISNDSGSGGPVETSLDGETSSYGLLDALISNVGRRTNYIEVPMPPHALSEKDI